MTRIFSAEQKISGAGMRDNKRHNIGEFSSTRKRFW